MNKWGKKVAKLLLALLIISSKLSNMRFIRSFLTRLSRRNYSNHIELLRRKWNKSSYLKNQKLVRKMKNVVFNDLSVIIVLYWVTRVINQKWKVNVINIWYKLILTLQRLIDDGPHGIPLFKDFNSNARINNKLKQSKSSTSHTSQQWEKAGKIHARVNDTQLTCWNLYKNDDLKASLNIIGKNT